MRLALYIAVAGAVLSQGYPKTLDGVSAVPMTTETLPPLKVPRSGFHLLEAGDELVVIGGHSPDMTPLRSSEYFRDGVWMQGGESLSPQDGAFCLVLRSGTVLVGSSQVEKYDIANHSFLPFAALSSARTFASALELPSGDILISGNWLSDDSAEVLDENGGCRSVQPVAEGRVRPVLIANGKDNAWLLSCGMNNLGAYQGFVHDSTAVVRVEQLKGPELTLTLPSGWLLAGDPQGQARYTTGPGAALLPVRRASNGDAGVLRFVDGKLFPLETDVPFPKEGLDGSPLSWTDWFYVFAEERRAYFAAVDEQDRPYFLEIHYDPIFDGRKARLTLHFLPDADPSFREEHTMEALSQGRIARVGSGVIYHLVSKEPPKRLFLGWWILGGVLLLGGCFLWGWMLRHNHPPKAKDPLTRQLVDLLEKDKIYLRKGLLMTDLAQELHTNRTYLSARINLHYGKPFADVVNGLRVAYAQRLMREHPDMRMTDVASQSGFTNESSFFRHFKAITSQTPTEWRVHSL